MKRIQSSRIDNRRIISQRVKTANANSTPPFSPKQIAAQIRLQTQPEQQKKLPSDHIPNLENDGCYNQSVRYSPNEYALKPRYKPLAFVGNSVLKNQKLNDGSRQSDLGISVESSTQQNLRSHKHFINEQRQKQLTMGSISNLPSQLPNRLSVDQMYRYKKSNEHRREKNHMFQAFANLRKSMIQENLFQYQLRNHIYNRIKLQSYSQPQHLALKHLEKQKLKQSHLTQL